MGKVRAEKLSSICLAIQSIHVAANFVEKDSMVRKVTTHATGVPAEAVRITKYSRMHSSSISIRADGNGSVVRKVAVNATHVPEQITRAFETDGTMRAMSANAGRENITVQKLVINAAGVLEEAQKHEKDSAMRAMLVNTAGIVEDISLARPHEAVVVRKARSKRASEPGIVTHLGKDANVDVVHDGQRAQADYVMSYEAMDGEAINWILFDALCLIIAILIVGCAGLCLCWIATSAADEDKSKSPSP